MINARIDRLETIGGGKLWERLKYELKYARRVNDVNGSKYTALLSGALDMCEASARRDGCATDATVLAVEAALAPMAADCKKYTLLLCGHAHIDMNWMWRYDETVQITLDTFDTVLRLMDEYPGFTFSQSQASVYKIIEEYAPETLPRIAARVKEGRWEITASTWVEADRNMPAAESIARQELYTRKYLSSLFGEAGVCEIDFEPDTFGHNQNTPELLHNAGVKYYYHCRGLDGQTLYSWRSPSGARVLAYREPYWYNDEVNGSMAEFAPEFCEQFGIGAAMRVYGVGDHGGGPTRRDIERALDMMSWPIYASVKFGTFREFFRQAESAKEIPTVSGEHNPLFVGCYTTQTSIKKGNRFGERMLSEAERLCALAGVKRPAGQLEDGWISVLFNQFHDILPGSGVIGTREYAMGLYQKAYAAANSAKRAALREIAGRIDTSKLGLEAAPGARASGAGVGFKVAQNINVAPVGLGAGNTRAFHLFNSLPFDRREVCEVTLWDWQGDFDRLTVEDAHGRAARFQIIEKGGFWAHEFARILVEAEIPACGYTTCVVREDTWRDLPVKFKHYETVEIDDDWTIENELLTAECDPASFKGGMALTEKATGEAHVVDGFSYVLEDASRGMTAWVVGDEASRVPACKNIRAKRTAKGELYNELTFTGDVGERSNLEWKVSLRAGSPVLRIDVKCDWLETASARFVPQLRFDVLSGDPCQSSYVYDVPGGQLERSFSDNDLPGLRFIASPDVMLMTDSKYGYRGALGKLGVTLIRSSKDPDPYPEQGAHEISLGLAPLSGAKGPQLSRMAQAFESPITSVSALPHGGDAPLAASLMKITSGDVELYALKRSEDGGALIARGAELNGENREARIEFARDVVSAEFCDTYEKPLKECAPIRLSGSEIAFEPRPFGVFALRVTLAN